MREKYETKVNRKMQNSNGVTTDNGQITIEEIIWKIMKAAMTTAREVLGTQKYRYRKTWYDNECAKAIEKRNRLHKKYIQRRTRDRREASKKKR